MRKTRFCDAWPCEGEVLPKAIETLVTKDSIESLIKNAFDSVLEDPESLKPEPLKTDLKSVPEKHKAMRTDVIRTDVRIEPIWIAFAILAFFTFYAFTVLSNRVENLESWLHGRMMPRT